MALWCATSMDRTRFAKSSVNKVLTLCSLLPLPTSVLVEFGNISQLVRSIQRYHGQTAEVSAMNLNVRPPFVSDYLPEQLPTSKHRQAKDIRFIGICF